MVCFLPRTRPLREGEALTNPPMIMSERSDHSRNDIGKVRIEACAKSFILQVYEVLPKHQPLGARMIGAHQCAKFRHW